MPDNQESKSLEGQKGGLKRDLWDDAKELYAQQMAHLTDRGRESWSYECVDTKIECANIVYNNLSKQLTATQQALDRAVEALNLAYNERNQLVAALSKIFPSWLGIHDITDTEWNAEWYSIVYINAPTGQLSWHFHDDDMKYFQHLKFEKNIEWDGHSTEEKYKRLAALASIKDNTSDIYQHYKGALYRFITKARDKRTGEPHIVYKSVNDGAVWFRPEDEFNEKFEKLEADIKE